MPWFYALRRVAAIVEKLSTLSVADLVELLIWRVSKLNILYIVFNAVISSKRVRSGGR